MKGIKEVVLVAAAVAGASAQPHQHQHRHQHIKKHDHSPVELAKRYVDWVSTTVAVYIDENGQTIDPSQAVAGIDNGLYVVVGETTPTFTPPPQPTSTSTSTSSTKAAQFYEQKSTSSSSAAAASGTATSGGTGLNAVFPSGQIPCKNGLPTQYGPISLDWLNLDGWAGFQVPSNGWTPGVAVESIVAPISGGCPNSAFCSYACPPGYQKSQWPPTSQGASGQSVGGLWCNPNGFLELTNPAYSQLCIPGAGGVYVKNELSENVAICRTDYPGSESMVVPLNVLPGQTDPLTNPSASSYYMWEGKYTSAQYYVNDMGVPVNEACLWNSPSYPSSAGNWAPMNIGVGQNTEGVTYISIFLNQPTSSATLNFNIEITGDVSGTCAYKGGSFQGGTSTGCTTAITSSGGTATIVFTSS